MANTGTLWRERGVWGTPEPPRLVPVPPQGSWHLAPAPSWGSYRTCSTHGPHPHTGVTPVPLSPHWCHPRAEGWRGPSVRWLGEVTRLQPTRVSADPPVS